jgi:hypothetical protein
MKKGLLAVLIVLLVVVIGVPIGVLVYIDSIAKSAVEHGGTYALGVKTTLDSMDVGVASGRVEMARLNIDNPAGFDTPHFLHLDDGRFAVSLGTLREDKIVSPELTLSGVSMNLERKGGKSNYAVIIDNLKRFESKDKPAEKKEETKSGKRFIIERVAINDVKVQVDLLPIGGELTRVPLHLDQVVLTNVGSDGDKGVMLADLTAILTEAILAAVVEKGGDLIPKDIAGELTKGLEGLEGLQGAAMQVVGGVTTEVTKQMDQVGKEVGKAIDEGGKQAQQQLEDAGKQIGKQVGGLLDVTKKKDKEKEGGDK